MYIYIYVYTCKEEAASFMLCIYICKCSNQVMTKAEPTVASEQPSDHVFTTDIAKLSCTMHSTPSETAPLVEGPDGFAIAKFSNLVHVTELANILLSPVADLVKARAQAKAESKQAKKACKKPAAACKKPAAAEAAALAVEPAAESAAAPIDAGPAAEASVRNYQILWYKNGHNIGIRQLFGAKTQIFSVGGKNCHKTEVQLRAIGKIAIGDLNAGMSPAKVKQKARAFANPVYGNT